MPITEQNPEEFSQFIQDMEDTWMSDQNVGALGYSLIEYLQEIPEEDAALLLSELLKPYLELELHKRLNAVGILVGELTPNRLTPSGVRSILRSGTPMILIAQDNSPDYHRPSEIARAIGEMVYGHDRTKQESVIKFLRAFNLKTTAVDGVSSKPIEG